MEASIPEDNINKLKILGLPYSWEPKATLNLRLENFHLCRLLTSTNKHIKKKTTCKRLRDLTKIYSVKVLTNTFKHFLAQTCR